MFEYLSKLMAEPQRQAATRARVKYISKYIYQIFENKVKPRMRHIAWRMSLRVI